MLRVLAPVGVRVMVSGYELPVYKNRFAPFMMGEPPRVTVQPLAVWASAGLWTAERQREKGWLGEGVGWGIRQRPND